MAACSFPHARVASLGEIGVDYVTIQEWLETWGSAAWSWLSQIKPDQLTAWATLALVLVTYRLAMLTRVLARETRTTREAGERADVQCAIQPHEEHINIAELVIANLGAASAIEISLTYGPTISGNKESKTKTLKLSRLLPGTRIRATVGSYVDMHTQTFRASGTFKDRFGERPIAYEQELGGWLGLSRVSGHPEYKTAEALSKIAEVIGRWAPTGRLEVSTFSSRERDKEQQLLSEFHEEAERCLGQPPSNPENK